MKLVSKEICPVSVRDRLIKNLAGQDVNVCDLRAALEWAESKCLELNKENEELGQVIMQTKDILSGLNRSRKSDKMILFELDKEYKKITNEQS